MTWLFIFTSIALTVYCIKSRNDRRNEERIQRGSIDALIAAIGENDDRDELVKNYFKNIENSLSVADCEMMLRNMCIATGIRPRFDSAGLIDDKTIAQLIDEFSIYAKNKNNSLKNQQDSSI